MNAVAVSFLCNLLIVNHVTTTWRLQCNETNDCFYKIFRLSPLFQGISSILSIWKANAFAYRILSKMLKFLAGTTSKFNFAILMVNSKKSKKKYAYDAVDFNFGKSVAHISEIFAIRFVIIVYFI